MTDQTIVGTEQRPGCLVAVVNAAELDERLTRSMEAEVRARAGESRELALILDLGAVEYLPSVSLGALVTISSDCKRHGQRFVMAGVQPKIREALALTRLDKLFEIADSVDAAAASVQQSGA
jgi:anti-sigma B factor antagonist